MPDVPKNAKKPEDRKPKAEKVETPQERTITVRGTEFTIAADALDDFELLDDLHGLDNEDPTKLPSVLRRLLGDQFKTALDLARDKTTGRVSVEAGADVVREVMEALDPN